MGVPERKPAWYGDGTGAWESHAPGFSKELPGFPKCNAILRSQFHLFHRLLIPLLQFFIQRDVLVDRQGLAARVARDQLKLGVGKARIAGQPCDALVPEGMGRGLDPGLLRILLDDLLDPSRSILPIPLGLEQPAIPWMGGNVGAEGRGEGLAEQNKPVLAALPLVDPDLAVLQVHVGDFDVAEFRHPDGGVEHQPQHQGVLHIVGLIHHAVESPEAVGGQNARQLLCSLRRLQVALLPDPPRNLSPVVVGQALAPDEAGNLGDDLGLAGFRFSVL